MLTASEGDYYILLARSALLREEECRLLTESVLDSEQKPRVDRISEIF